MQRGHAERWTDIIIALLSEALHFLGPVFSVSAVISNACLIRLLPRSSRSFADMSLLRCSRVGSCWAAGQIPQSTVRVSQGIDHGRRPQIDAARQVHRKETPTYLEERRLFFFSLGFFEVAPEARGVFLNCATFSCMSRLLDSFSSPRTSISICLIFCVAGGGALWFQGWYGEPSQAIEYTGAGPPRRQHLPHRRPAIKCPRRHGVSLASTLFVQGRTAVKERK